MRPPDKILVVVTRRIGDVLLTTPLIRSLRRTWPKARIDVLVFKGTEGVISANTDINQIITIDQRPTLKQHLRILLSLWRSYDIAVSVLPGDRPTIYARVAGKHCVGMKSEESNQKWKQWLMSQSVQFDNINTHTVLMNLQLADLVGAARSYEVVTAWNNDDEAAVYKVLPFDPEIQSYAVLHVFPMYPYKAWRNECWVELTNWICSQGLRVVITGGKSTEEIKNVRDLIKLLPGDTVDAAGRLNLASVAYLLSKARAFVGPDTVVTHLAASGGTPTVALFGPSNPVKWGPWPKGHNKNSNPFKMHDTQRINNVVLLQGSGDCVPCMQEGCERHTGSLSNCLQNLPAIKAIESLNKLLNL